MKKLLFSAGIFAMSALGVMGAEAGDANDKFADSLVGTYPLSVNAGSKYLGYSTSYVPKEVTTFSGYEKYPLTVLKSDKPGEVWINAYALGFGVSYSIKKSTVYYRGEVNAAERTVKVEPANYYIKETAEGSGIYTADDSNSYGTYVYTQLHTVAEDGTVEYHPFTINISDEKTWVFNTPYVSGQEIESWYVTYKQAYYKLLCAVWEPEGITPLATPDVKNTTAGVVDEVAPVFEWPAVNGAKVYVWTLTTAAGVELSTGETAETKLSFDALPDDDYKLTVKARSEGFRCSDPATVNFAVAYPLYGWRYNWTAGDYYDTYGTWLSHINRDEIRTYTISNFLGTGVDLQVKAQYDAAEGYYFLNPVVAESNYWSDQYGKETYHYADFRDADGKYIPISYKEDNGTEVTIAEPYFALDGYSWAEWKDGNWECEIALYDAKDYDLYLAVDFNITEPEQPLTLDAPTAAYDKETKTVTITAPVSPYNAENPVTIKFAVVLDDAETQPTEFKTYAEPIVFDDNIGDTFYVYAYAESEGCDKSSTEMVASATVVGAGSEFEIYTVDDNDNSEYIGKSIYSTVTRNDADKTWTVSNFLNTGIDFTFGFTGFATTYYEMTLDNVKHEAGKYSETYIENEQEVTDTYDIWYLLDDAGKRVSMKYKDAKTREWVEVKDLWIFAPGDADNWGEWSSKVYDAGMIVRGTDSRTDQLSDYICIYWEWAGATSPKTLAAPKGTYDTEKNAFFVDTPATLVSTPVTINWAVSTSSATLTATKVTGAYDAEKGIDLSTYPADETLYIWVKYSGKMYTTKTAKAATVNTVYDAATTKIYTPVTAVDQLKDGNWAIVVAEHSTDGTHAVTRNHDAAAVTKNVNGKIPATAETFANVAEFVLAGDATNGWSLATKDGTCTLGPIEATPASRASSPATITVNADGTATMAWGDNTLGFHDENKVFGYTSEHSTPVQLYTSDSTLNLNSGVDNVAAEELDQDGPVEYFNLQGIRVENPARGLYIRRQGNKATKVLF